MNKTKIIVSTLALAMGAALAGSVSGTVAWFQYSTRAQGTYIGTSAHCSEMLEMAANGSGTYASVVNNISSAAGGNKLEPITTGAFTKDSELDVSKLKRNPVYQIEDPAGWVNATNNNYVQFTLKFRVRDVNTTSTYLSDHKLYLLDVDIVSLADSSGASTSDLDLYKAVRVHISNGTGEGSYNKLFANGSTETATNGYLDLNGDGDDDLEPGYSWSGTLDKVNYGIADSKQTTYDASDKSIFADDSDLNAIVANGNELGTISDSLTITVTIWLEGWTKLGGVDAVTGVKYTTEEAAAYNEEHNLNEGDPGYVTTDDWKVEPVEAQDGSATWNAADYIGKNFGVGLRFGTDAHKVTE